MPENVPQVLKFCVCRYVTALKIPLPLKINVTIFKKIVDPLPLKPLRNFWMAPYEIESSFSGT